MSFAEALSSSSLSTAVALLAAVVLPVVISLHAIGCAKKKVSRETATTTTASRSTDGSKKTVVAHKAPKPDKEPTTASRSARSQKAPKDQKCQKDQKKPVVDDASQRKQHSTEDTDLRSIQNVPKLKHEASKNPAAGARAGGELAPTQTPTVPLPPQSACAKPEEANAAGMSLFVTTAAKPVKPGEEAKQSAAPKESSNNGSKKGSKEPSRAEPARDQAGAENHSKNTAADTALPGRHSKTASDDHEGKSAQGKNTKNSVQKKSTTTNAANQVESPEGLTKYTDPQ